MPLPDWLSLPSPARAARAWVGVQPLAEHWIVARAEGPRPGARPRVLGCASLAGDDALVPLRRWWRSHAARHDRATQLLEPADYQMLQIPAPAVEPSEYRAAARWQLKDLIDFPTDQAAIDCFGIPGDGAAAPKLHAVVARQALVARTVTMWRGAGLKLAAIDIPEMALRNLALLASGETACAFLHVGFDDARLLLLWQRELCVARQLGVAGSSLRGSDEWQRQAQIERLALEIQRSVDAFGRQFSSADLGQLWVSSVHDPAGLAEALAAQVSLRVKPYLVEEWIDFAEGARAVDAQRGIDHLPAIGAALREDAPQ